MKTIAIILISLMVTFPIATIAGTKIEPYQKPNKIKVQPKKEKKVKVKLDTIPTYSEEYCSTENVIFPKTGIDIDDRVIRIEITSKNYEVIMEDTN